MSKLKNLKEAIISSPSPFFYGELAEHLDSPADKFKSQRASEVFLRGIAPFRDASSIYEPRSLGNLEALDIDKTSLTSGDNVFIECVDLDESIPEIPRHFVFHHTFKTVGSLMRDHIIASSRYHPRIDMPIYSQDSTISSRIRLVPPVLQSSSGIQSLRSMASMLPVDTGIASSFVCDHCLPSNVFYNDLINKMDGQVLQFSFYLILHEAFEKIAYCLPSYNF